MCQTFSFSRCSNHKSSPNLDNYSNSTNFELASTAFETGTNWTQADGLSTVQQAEAASGLAWPLLWYMLALKQPSFLSFFSASLHWRSRHHVQQTAAQFKLSLCGIGGELRRISSPRQKSFCFEILTFLIDGVSTLTISQVHLCFDSKTVSRTGRWLDSFMRS